VRAFILNLKSAVA